MRALIAAIIGVAIVTAYFQIKARRIVRRRSRELAMVTGLDPEVVRRDMTRRRMTPGEWAIEHGLSPVTFKPLDVERHVLTLQAAYAQVNARHAPLLEDTRQLSRFTAALAVFGAKPDPELNAEIKRRLDVPDTPFNT